MISGESMLPIHVISLAEADDRRRSARAEMARQSVDFEFFDALDGDRGAGLFDRIDKEAFVLATGRQPTGGEIRCLARPQALWQRCVHHARALLTIEPTCRLAAEFRAAVAAAGELVDPLGLVRLQDERRGASRPVGRYGEFQVERYTKTPHCTMCYAVSPAVAARLIEANPAFRAPVDVVMKQVWTYGNPMYCLTPYTVSDHPGCSGSVIGARVKCDRSAATRLRRFLLKAGWQWRRLRFNLAQSRRADRSRLPDTPRRAEGEAGASRGEPASL